MGKTITVNKIIFSFFVLLFPLWNVEALSINPPNFPGSHDLRKEHFVKILERFCAIRLKINQKYPRFPVPKICKTRDTRPPTLEFYAESQSIVEGESVALYWASNNTLSCEASGGWSEEKSLSGEEIVFPLVTTTYTLSCDGVENGVEKSIEIIVNPLPPPPPPPLDVCPNLDGLQEVIPEGYHDENGQCIANVPLPPPPPTNVLDHIIISEVYYLGSSGADEWVEIYNGTGNPVLIDGWTISDAVSSDVVPTATIPAGGFAVIVGSTSSLLVPASAQKLVLSNSTIGSGLNNTGGDAVFIKNKEGIVVDSMSYGNNDTGFISGSGVPLVSTGHSIYRLDLTSDTDTALDWGDLALPTPGQ